MMFHIGAWPQISDVRWSSPPMYMENSSPTPPPKEPSGPSAMVCQRSNINFSASAMPVVITDLAPGHSPYPTSGLQTLPSPNLNETPVEPDSSSITRPAIAIHLLYVTEMPSFMLRITANINELELPPYL